MSDTDWCEWVATDDPKQHTDKTSDRMEPIITPDIVCDFDELVLIKILKHFPIDARIALSAVCLKWSQCVDKSFKSEPLLSVSTMFGKEVEPSSATISTKALCLMIRKCCNVRTIDLKDLSTFTSDKFAGNEVEDNIMATVVSNCHLLESIDFGHLTDIDDYIIKHIEYFRRIKKIVSKRIEEKSLNCLMDSQNLETIDITDNDKISRPELKRLGPKITELQLIGSEVTDETVFRDLCDGYGKRISTLSVDIRNKSILSLICKHLIQLKAIKFRLFSQNPDFDLFSNLIHLEDLEMDVTDDSRLTPQDFKELMRSLKSSHLLHLRVILSPINNIAINDNSLQDIRQNCQSLETLEIRCANSLTGATLSAIAQMTRLKTLSFRDCLNITDEIAIVIASCPLLRVLVLHNCSHITKTVVDAFIAKAETYPSETFRLDVVDTNVTQESVPQSSELPNNLKILYEDNHCEYGCDHGWAQQNGYNSGPDDFYDGMDDLDVDFDNEDDFRDYYNDYDDEDLDYGLS